MNGATSPLGIGAHRLVAAVTEDDSVTCWRCLDCEREFHCTSECLSADCLSLSPDP